ncbi:MAG: primosomal protein N' [Bdellovibrionales bacterium]|nr:primosomal protein N' [Bdellovibrionales bacterium]
MNANGPKTCPETWTVAIDAPLGPLHYTVPDTLEKLNLKSGTSVIVPLGSRKVHGVLLDSDTAVPAGVKLKAMFGLAEERPPIDSARLEWLKWISRYYAYPLGSTLEHMFPPLAKSGGRKKARKAALIQVSEIQGTDHSVSLTPNQTDVVNTIAGQKGFHAHLLFGVTGSGKTEVYMELIGRAVDRGETALVLVPEISLTPQLIERFARRFGDKIAVIHSHLTPREKTDNWWAAQTAEKPVLIGARSALFCPQPNLGLIVIDEEHESSFKQDESLRYHARDSAVMLAKILKIPIVLGSATPSLETWQNATSGKYELHRLPSRIHGTQMPKIDVIDLREARDAEKQSSGDSGGGRPFWLSKELHLALTETLERGEQAALFLNRRGIAQTVVCPSCGHSSECPNCEVALTLHGRSNLVCHYCDYHESMKEVCGSCHTGEPKPLGLGTERIENDLGRLFPTARLVRMDRDEIQSREDLEEAIAKIENREADVLIGTQMIAKGLDFPGLTLVGLVLADVAFNLPDFRASERAFQLLTQVAGRAGRHLRDGRQGHVVLQTYNPDHPSIQYTLAHDYEGFATHDLQFREALGYPPMGRLAALKFGGPDLAETEAAARRIADLARRTIDKAVAADPHSPSAGISVLGPAPAPMAKLRNLYRFQILIKGSDAKAPVSALCRTLSEHIEARARSKSPILPPKVRFAVDVDALHLL